MKYFRLNSALRYENGFLINPYGKDVYSSPIEAIIEYDGRKVLMVAHGNENYPGKRKDGCDACSFNGRGVRQIYVWGYVINERRDGFDTELIEGETQDLEDFARAYFGRIAPETGFRIQVIGH